MEQEAFYDMEFPRAGIDRTNGFGYQLPLQLPMGEYGRTCREGVNVRAFDGIANRARGGTRQGLQKHLPEAIVEGWIVQELTTLVGKGYDPPGGTVQLSSSGRVVNLVAVSQGNVYVANPGDDEWTAAENVSGQTPPLIYTGVLHSTALNQNLWFADGMNYIYYDPAVNKVYQWLASDGALPVDFRGNTPRLICTWRGRIVLSGLLFDPQNWFMSRVGDPTDWNYSPNEISQTQPVAGNNSPLGLVGDVITTLIPYNDDVLIFGGDHTIYLMQGDPMAGGQLDLVTNSIGMAWGIPWAMDPSGVIYFVSNRTGIYAMTPGQQPQRISQQVEQILQEIDTGSTTIRLLWNDRFQGLHVFLSPTREPSNTQHLFWEARTRAWWQDEFANPNFDPLACCVFDGNLPGDRAVLIGSWDGYVRSFSGDATDDDGEKISSEVVIGPITSKNLDEILLKDLQAVLGETSASVQYAVYVGATAEIALDTTPVATGTWNAGRNLNTLIRRSGHAVYVKLSSDEPWAMETIRARIAGQGKIRRRGI